MGQCPMTVALTLRLGGQLPAPGHPLSIQLSQSRSFALAWLILCNTMVRSEY